jgi:hypothetical protein
MTEAEWLAAGDVGAMLGWLKTARRAPRVPTRKLQLFGQAVAESVAELAGIPAAVEVMRLTGGAAARGELLHLDRRKRERFINAVPPGWAGMLCRFLLAISTPDAWQRNLPEDHAALVAYWARWRLGPEVTDWHASLLREVVGNPFRPVAFRPDWRTSDALALATQMHESRDFGAMPILADALQDAGCDSEDVLSHCRDGGPHVRDCWVVDLILGKE